MPLRARVASSHLQKKFGITCPLLLCSDHLLKNFFKSLLDSAEVCASDIGAMRLEAAARAPAARAPAARAPALPSAEAKVTLPECRIPTDWLVLEEGGFRPLSSPHTPPGTGAPHRIGGRV